MTGILKKNQYKRIQKGSRFKNDRIFLHLKQLGGLKAHQQIAMHQRQVDG